MQNQSFTFEISLSVLNHLGRNLYRSFTTVLGEAISNSWDADAKKVFIYIDKDNNSLLIKDDGEGMNSTDFQEKFLKIGYSKRKNGTTHSELGRPYIGRKGIGKLALLSCAEKVHIISKKKDSDYVGGVIDNSGLDGAIQSDLKPSEYPLEKINLEIYGEKIKNHISGTIIYFENIKEGIRNSLDYLRRVVALYFRFALIDDSFNIFINDEGVTLNDLKDLTDNTEFLWNINNFDDPFVKRKMKYLKEPEKYVTVDAKVEGFIASVTKPRHLKITADDEKVSIDLFVNGRLRDKNILRHIPTDRLASDYLYGQIHINSLDDNKDRFTSSREGIVEGDPLFLDLLSKLKPLLSKILDDWDKFRLKNREDGDSENVRLTRKERSSRGLFNAISEEYGNDVNSEIDEESKDDNSSKERNNYDLIKQKIHNSISELQNDAEYNFTSYAECFISENLVRKHIEENNIQLSKEAKIEVDKWKHVEAKAKSNGNISIEIRRFSNDSKYLDMGNLANLVDKGDQAGAACLSRDAREYKPIRDAVMHTCLLTDEAKTKLTSVHNNIKWRIINLLIVQD
ncbi:ATP-binding protein [Candidatus Woesearchaeota archaeon]|nr:ATP-binding protein [Candidatus Woesearchaeota archaeon]